MVRFWPVLLIASAALLPLLSPPRSAHAIQGPKALSLPFQKPDIAANSWFDHNLPDSGANDNMRRYHEDSC